MSNLRDRLKRISSERKQEQPLAQAQQKPTCASRIHFAEVPAQTYSPEILMLLGGADFDGLHLAPEDWIFIDTETNGLSGGAGTIAFEIGVGEVLNGQMRITQFWIRDYDQEEDMLHRLDALFQNKKAIVSFNGKSFDLPLLISRCTLNRIRPAWQNLPHLDLLHAARRVYKLRLKRCSLSDLEERVLGIRPEDDIPGSEIPALWQEFLKTKNDEKLLSVFDHNLQDVQSMAVLLRTIYDAHQEPMHQVYMEDLFSVGKVYDSAGRYDIAERCYVSVENGVCRGMAGRALTRIYRRTERTADAIALLESMIASNSGGIFPYVELAKIYEHRLRQPEKALTYTDLALAKAVDAQDIQDLTRRRTRLAARIRRKDGK